MTVQSSQGEARSLGEGMQLDSHPSARFVAAELAEAAVDHRDLLLSGLQTPTVARIDLAALRQNIEVIRSFIAPQVQLLAMVKANAYGHGMLAVAREAEAAGVGYFGIARVEEGIELRRAGFRQRVLLLELAAGERAVAAIRLNLEITVASLDQAVALSDLACRLGLTARIHVEVDTGMGRIGVHHREAAQTVRDITRLPHLELAGVFSHFASSDDPDQAFAREQLQRFNAVLGELERLGVKVPLRHFANSGAVMTLPEAHFDLVRVGIMLYGYPPSGGLKADGLAPVLALQSQVSYLKTVEGGTPISYDRRYVAPRKTRIATVLAGYGDGYSRSLTNNAEVLIRGRRYPVVGTVCMDMIMVDVGLDSDVSLGDSVTLIGQEGNERITAWELALRQGTIPYEITCQIAERVPRVCIDSSRATKPLL